MEAYISRFHLATIDQTWNLLLLVVLPLDWIAVLSEKNQFLFFFICRSFVYLLIGIGNVSSLCQCETNKGCGSAFFTSPAAGPLVSFQPLCNLDANLVHCHWDALYSTCFSVITPGLETCICLKRCVRWQLQLLWRDHIWLLNAGQSDKPQL